MNYEKLIKEFSKRAEIDFETAAEFIDTFFTTIKIGLSKNEKVKISDFGTFSPKVYKSKIIKNKETGEIENIPEKILPHYYPSKKIFSKTSSKDVKSKKELKIYEINNEIENEIPKEDIKNNISIFKKFIPFLIILLVLNTLLSFYISFKLLKSRYVRNYFYKIISNYLDEKGLSYNTINEMVDSKFQEVINKTEEYNQQLQSTFSSQLQKLKESQEESLEKLKEIENNLKVRIEKMIKPLSQKRGKKTEVKLILYEIKKNDTLWDLSKKYMNNPYNWVGLYQTNGEKIKDPHKIYPGMKIFIPLIIEKDDTKREDKKYNKR